MKRVALILVWIVTSEYKAQDIIVQNLLNDVRLDSLTTFVKQLTGQVPVKIRGVLDTIKSRHSQHPDNEIAFQFLKEQFIRYGYQIDSLQFSNSGKNLFAIKPGYKYPERRYMLGAHYDNLPAQGIAQGADDNASGSAAVLEAGRIFKNYSFPCTVVFALWDEEEQGLLGSISYVATLGNSADTLLGYVNVDMLGWDGNNDSVADINTRNVANTPAFANRSNYCNTAYTIGLKIHILNPGEESSDHAPFWNAKYNAISVGEEHHTNFYPYWHTSGDSLAHFNLSFFKKCAKLAYATIADCAIDTVNIVGIKEYFSLENIEIYPNPFSTNFYVSLKNALATNYTLKISDTSGKIMLETENNAEIIEINTSSFPTGLYTIQITNGTSLYTSKIMKR